VLDAAIRDGETAVTNALFGAPKFQQVQLVSVPDLLEQMRERWLSNRSPETVRQLRALESAIAATERSLQAARQFILETPGVDAESLMVQLGMDPLRDANGGLRDLGA
jgi:hypothetical protein